MHFRQWLARKILPQAKRVHAWAAMQLIDDYDAIVSIDTAYEGGNLVILPEHMLSAARQIIERELDQIIVTGRLAAFNQITEEEIIRTRLARRYDPGMAMNEAFARAAEKAKNEPHPVSGMSQKLTDNQQAALKFQEKFLRENAARAPRPLGE